MAKSARDRIAAKARRATTEAQKAEWRAAWLRVVAAGGGTEQNREAMLRALLDGKSVDEAFALMFPPCPVPLRK
ncbi:hypothetical protein ACQR1I_36745 [Bradyrhizobium sp. HKCCYLS2038]|uniref:hypothetical protein n=1 Tax=Bradyrhizobium sp. HKCCYLS2038 TaxID=3420764 RepID=UPI003EB72175